MPSLKERLNTRKRKTNASDAQRDKWLNSISGWYRDCLGLRVKAPEQRINSKGDPVGWVDMSPGSAYLRRIAFWRSSWEIQKRTGAWIFMDMEPRYSGKSIVMLGEAARLVVGDRNTTIGYGAQNKKEAGRRANWLRKTFISQPITSRFGNFKSNQWEKDRIWVEGSKHRDQPSVGIFAPGGSITGLHPGLWILDDFVDEKNSRSFALQEQVFSTWNDILQAGASNTMVWIIGTPWPGVFHLYDLIADKYGENAVIQYVPAIGSAIDQYGKQLFSEKGVQNYPWISPQFLERQRMLLPEHLYIGAYEVKRASAKQMFKLKQFQREDPPKTDMDPLNGKNLDRRQANVYMITDPANNEGGQRGLSKAAIAVVAKYANGHAYVLDMRLDHMTSDIFLNEFEKMWDRWKPITHYGMETSGPGNMYPGWIEERFKARGWDLPARRPISRQYSGKKEDRIMTLHQPLADKKLKFATTVDPRVIDWQDHTTIPIGDLAEEAQRFNPHGNKESMDGLDCLADIYWADKDGPICPTPSARDLEELSAKDAYNEMWKDRVSAALWQGGDGVKEFRY